MGIRTTDWGRLAGSTPRDKNASAALWRGADWSYVDHIKPDRFKNQPKLINRDSSTKAPHKP